MGLHLPRHPGELGVHGHFTWTIRDADTGQIHEEFESDNLITNNGLQNLAYGFIYNLVQNQNLGWGQPIGSQFANLGDCWGAVGTGSTAPLATDIALTNEISRTLVTNAAVTATNSFELDFFFGTGQANGVIAEAGVFTTAFLYTTTLTSQLNNTTTYSSLAVNPYSIPGHALSSGDIFLINYGATTPVQYCQSSAQITNGATSISITAPGGGTFTANATYPVGTTVAYGPNASGTVGTDSAGTLFDHAVFSPTTTKNSSETATLGLQITLTTA